MAKMMTIVAAAALSQVDASTCFDDIIDAAEQGVPIAAEVATVVASCSTGTAPVCVAGVSALVISLGKLSETITSAVGDCGGASEKCIAGVKKVEDDINSMLDAAKKMTVDCTTLSASCAADVVALGEAAKPILDDMQSAARGCASSVSYDWCDCGKGLNWVDVWDPANTTDRHRIQIGGWSPITWSTSVSEINWVCDGMSDTQKANLPASKKWKMSFTKEAKTICVPPSTLSGRIEWDSAGDGEATGVVV